MQFGERLEPKVVACGLRSCGPTLLCSHCENDRGAVQGLPYRFLIHSLCMPSESCMPQKQHVPSEFHSSSSRASHCLNWSIALLWCGIIPSACVWNASRMAPSTLAMTSCHTRVRKFWTWGETPSRLSLITLPRAALNGGLMNTGCWFFATRMTRFPLLLSRSHVSFVIQHLARYLSICRRNLYHVRVVGESRNARSLL